MKINYKQKIEAITFCLGLLSIAVLPFYFVRIFTIAGLQIGIFQLVSFIFIVISLPLFIRKIANNLSYLEIFIFIFLIIIITNILFNNVFQNGIAYLLKITFYVLYFRLLKLSFSTNELNTTLPLLYKVTIISLFFFCANFILGYLIYKFDFPVHAENICTNSNNQKYIINYEEYNIKTGSFIPKQNRLLYQFTIPSLAQFDELWPSKLLCTSRHIGPNVLASVFTLYLLIIL